MEEIKVSNDLDSATYKDGLMIRTKVFVNEQNVPSDLEVDADEAKCTYTTLYVDEHPAAVARFSPTEDNGVHIQRVAVLKEFRHRGLASKVINKITAIAKNKKYSYITLGAQDQANGFYKKIGFHVVGDQYEEAGILHHEMRKDLP